MLIGQEADKLLDDEAVQGRGAGGGAGKRHRLSGRDRQGLRPVRCARGRCQPRRRAARPAAADRGHDGFAPSTARSRPTISCSSPAAPSTSPSPRTCCPNCRAACRSGWSLQPLTEDDFVRILTETDNALTRQYAALMATEEVTVTFTPDGIAALARIAAEVNRSGREHRRAAALHGDGAGVRGTVLQRPRPWRAVGDGGCRPLSRPISARCARSADISRYVL